ncbi:hypothetical protein [Pseudomonas sp. PH1b]|uniref:hypothetical protein n=1 Tax=Pseudomonas sp. PH1b TaxID=1397282 RepID=UPI000469AB7E|nr:hypothetical protein [Pseudomonas sp. PH1b]
MADLPEIAEWTAGIYQLETSDPVLAGPDGIDNLQAKQLANRTRWLKDKTDSQGASLAGKASKATTLAGYGITDAFTKPEATSAIQQAIASLVASSPAALDTLKELADALGNDPNFATTMTNALAGKAGKATTLGGYGITDAFTKPETTSAIQQAIASLVASSPAALDTLKELADALGNDPNFATTMTNALAGKAEKATTLAGYGINNAYTKDEANNKFMAPLGFPPVQQGTGIGQTSSAIKIGWSAGGQLKATADATDLGHFWMSHNFNPASKADASAVAQATEAARGTVMLAGFADVNVGDGFKAMTANMFMNFSLGFRQVWRDMLGSRAAGVGYVNSTGKPIMVSVISSTNDRGLYLVVDNVTVSKQGQDGGTGSDYNCVQAVVAPGSTYAVGFLGGATISHWSELRA